MHAQSLQSCPTLCDPMDCNLPVSSVHEDSAGKNTGVDFHTLLQGIVLTQGSNPHLMSLALTGCFFTTGALYAEYIMRNPGLDDSQVGIKIAGRNINNLRYADDISLMAASEEELKSLLMRVKESEKSCLKLNIEKSEIIAFDTIISL